MKFWVNASGFNNLLQGKAEAAPPIVADGNKFTRVNNIQLTSIPRAISLTPPPAQD